MKVGREEEWVKKVGERKEKKGIKKEKKKVGKGDEVNKDEEG